MVQVQELTDYELSVLEEYREKFAEQWVDNLPGGEHITREDFLTFEVVGRDQDRPCNRGSNRINTRGQPETDWLKERFTGYDNCRNAIWFKPNTWMDWHTNSGDPGQRTYYVYNRGEGCFRWFDGNNYHESWEQSGWTKRVFTVPDPADGLLWHSVWAGDWRLSIGFVIWPKREPLPPLS